MANFWLTKKMLLEALRMSEGMPQSTFICFQGSSEGCGDDEKTVMTISVGGKKKTLREDFNKLKLSNGEA